MIPLHEPYLTGEEIHHIEKALSMQRLSGNGFYTQECQSFFENKFNFSKCLLTNSCTASLEFAALLTEIKTGDEVIIPSYTYVSTANPFILRGAKIVFVDSQVETPNMDVENLKTLITPKTKVIVVVHYAGIACPMEEIMELATQYNITVIEDAAHALGGYYNRKPLGSFGHLSAFSFHTTKNITSGEGGLLVVNDKNLFERADILWEKGTNRKAFLQGMINQYEWCDVGSSFYPSEITAALLYAQLTQYDHIQKLRMRAWQYYQEKLSNLKRFETPNIPEYALHNAHLYYLKANSEDERNALINHLNNEGISATFHYLALDQSPYGKALHSSILPNARIWEKQLVRLPLYSKIKTSQLDKIVNTIKAFDSQSI